MVPHDPRLAESLDAEPRVQKTNYKVLHGFLIAQCGNGVWSVFRNSTLLKGLLYIHKFL